MTTVETIFLYVGFNLQISRMFRNVDKGKKDVI